VAWRVRAVNAGNNLTITVELTPENQKESAQLSVIAPPTPTITPIPKPCTPSVTNPCK
jgi:hypothetical protein